jgi:hypothetical protein
LPGLDRLCKRRNIALYLNLVAPKVVGSWNIYIQVGVEGCETMMIQTTDVDAERRLEEGQASRFSQTTQGLNEKSGRLVFQSSHSLFTQSNRIDAIDSRIRRKKNVIFDLLQSSS